GRVPHTAAKDCVLCYLSPDRLLLFSLKGSRLNFLCAERIPSNAFVIHTIVHKGGASTRSVSWMVQSTASHRSRHVDWVAYHTAAAQPLKYLYSNVPVPTRASAGRR